MRVLLCSLLALVGSLTPAAAQDSQQPLLTLQGGERVHVRYTPGALQRATQLERQFELLVSEFAQWSGRKESLTLLLLSRSHWQETDLAMPYGLPDRLEGARVAVAAWGDQGTVDLWNRLLSWDLPVAEEAPWRSTDDEAGSLVATDVLAMVEVTRVLLERASWRGTEAWIGEVAAHTVAAAILARTQTRDLARVDSFYRALGRARRGAALPLSAFRAGISLEDWLWFQSRFFDAAMRIKEDQPRGSGKTMVKLGREGGVISRRRMLGAFAPLSGWLTTSFPAGD